MSIVHVNLKIDKHVGHIVKYLDSHKEEKFEEELILLVI